MYLSEYRTVEGITANQSHLAGPNRVFKRFVVGGIVERQGLEEDGVVWNDVVL